MADLNEFLPQVEVTFSEVDENGVEKTASSDFKPPKTLVATVNGRQVKLLNGNITQAALGLFQRLKDIEDEAPKMRKALAAWLASAFRAGIKVAEGVRSMVLNEKSRESPSYKAAFEEVTATWTEETRAALLAKHTPPPAKWDEIKVKVAK